MLVAPLQDGSLHSLSSNNASSSQSWDVPNTLEPLLQTETQSLTWTYGIWVLFLMCSTWLISNMALMMDNYAWKGIRRPPVMPHWVPGIGHTLTFVFDRVGLVKTISHYSQGKRALRLSIIGQKINVITGAENIQAIWKTKTLDSRPASILMLDSMLQGRSSNALRYWRNDDSGAGPKAHPQSTVAEADRIYHPTWKSSHAFLTIKKSEASAKHIQTRFHDIMTKSCPSHETMIVDDLRTFFQSHIATAVLDMMCGRNFLKLNPSFVDTFWEFDQNFPALMMGFTKWTAPAALRSRDECVKAIETWHAFADDNFDPSTVDEDGFDPSWGSELFRGRQDVWKKLDRMDANAKACEDLGIIWAMNTNTIPAIFWAVVHCYQDPELLARVRVEVEKARSESTTAPFFDVRKLMESPLLESICSEVLRLYVAAFIPRGSTHDVTYIAGQYEIPRGEFIAVDSYTAHRDETMWNTGAVPGTRPLDSFWAERFIIDPSNGLHGPLRTAAATEKSEESTSSYPKYSMDGLSGSWLPFGGGKHQCPGRYFARREMMVCMAVMCSEYDMQFMRNEKIAVDHSFFGIGTMPSKGAVPVRIQRRSS